MLPLAASFEGAVPVLRFVVRFYAVLDSAFVFGLSNVTKWLHFGGIFCYLGLLFKKYFRFWWI